MKKRQFRTKEDETGAIDGVPIDQGDGEEEMCGDGGGIGGGVKRKAKHGSGGGKGERLGRGWTERKGQGKRLRSTASASAS